MSDESKIQFHYIKTPRYQNFHADGAFGGRTPTGGLHIAFYIERQPIPTLISHQINDDGTLGNETGRECKSGVIREVECGVVMDIEVATGLRDWLTVQIEQLRKIQKEVKRQ